VLKQLSWDLSEETNYPEEDWKGWEMIATEAGLVARAKKLGLEAMDWGFMRRFWDEEEEVVKNAERLNVVCEDPDPDARPREQSEESLTDLSLDVDYEEDQNKKELEEELVPWRGDSVVQKEYEIEIVNKTVKSRRKGRQQVRYTVHFVGYPDSENICVDAAHLRKEHKDGANCIARYEASQKGRSVGTSQARAMLLKSKLEKKEDVSAEENDSYQSQPPEPQRFKGKRKKRTENPEEEDFFRTLNDAKNGPSETADGENFNPYRGEQGRSSKGHWSKARRKENRAPVGSTSAWERVEVENVAVGKNQLDITFSNGRVLSSKEAHTIPELRLKLLEKYEGTILALTQTFALITQK